MGGAQGRLLTLSESDLAELQGINERVSLDEVETIYLPLSRLAEPARECDADASFRH